MLMTVMLGDGGSATPGSGPSSMTVEVDADRLFATAHELEATAKNLADWLNAHGDRFSIRPAGKDIISTGVADFFHETWAGPDGALVQVRTAVLNLYKFADTMKSAATSYGLTDTANADALNSST